MSYVKGLENGAWASVAELSEFPKVAAKVDKWDFPGFGPMTRIDTMSGPFPAQTLRVGDRVRTRRGGFAEIRWLDRIALESDFLHRHPEAQPVLIPARALGQGVPHQDVVLSAGQRISLEGLMRHGNSCTAGELLGSPAARRQIETIFTYTMFICAEPVEVRVGGLWTKLEPPHW